MIGQFGICLVLFLTTYIFASSARSAQSLAHQSPSSHTGVRVLTGGEDPASYAGEVAPSEAARPEETEGEAEHRPEFGQRTEDHRLRGRRV